jgi:hypothetical protein
LIENGRPEEIAHLLFFGRVARESQCMAAPGKYCAGDIPVERRKKCERTFFEGEDRVAAAELDSVVWSDVVDGGRIDTEAANRII